MHPPLEIITSASNPLIKTLRALSRKKTRAQTGLFLAEGSRLVQQGLHNGWELETLIASRHGVERPHIQALIETARKAGARAIETTDRVMGQITGKDNPGALIGAFRQRACQLEELALPASKTGIWIALYEVRDPGNLGTILRTADCAGIAGIILLETCCDPYSVEAVRASMGSIFDVKIATTDFEQFDAWRHAEALTMIAASVNGTCRHDAAAYGNRAVILMGNEQSGLPAGIEAACNELCLIPMRGGADSLNLAQATALISYEAWRQQGYPGARER